MGSIHNQYVHLLALKYLCVFNEKMSKSGLILSIRNVTELQKHLFTHLIFRIFQDFTFDVISENHGKIRILRQIRPETVLLIA